MISGVYPHRAGRAGAPRHSPPSPDLGNVFAVAATPVFCCALMKACPQEVTVAAFLLYERWYSSMKVPDLSNTSSTGARLTITPTPARFCPAPVPAWAAAVVGFADFPICHRHRPQYQRTLQYATAIRADPRALPLLSRTASITVSIHPILPPPVCAPAGYGTGYGACTSQPAHKCLRPVKLITPGRAPQGHNLLVIRAWYEITVRMRGQADGGRSTLCLASR